MREDTEGRTRVYKSVHDGSSTVPAKQFASAVEFPKKSNGILLLNKPYGLSSNAALQKVKRHFRAQKAGHSGSLDPLATGMLPISLGEGTKFSQYVLDSDKTYLATGLLGIKTSTGDAEGEVIAQTDVGKMAVSQQTLFSVLQLFCGETQQTPSMFSALKHQGVPLYRYARQGIEIARAQRSIYISDLQLISYDGRQFVIQVTCSKGTYIRNLVEDIGERLQTFAHVTQLHRLYTAGYMDQRMIELDHLLSMSPAQSLACLLPIDTPVLHLAQVFLSFQECADLQCGKVLKKAGGVVGEDVRLYDENQVFLGLGIWLADDLLRAKRLVV